MILCNFTPSNGANTAAHVVKRIEIDPVREIATVHVQSFATEISARLEGSPLWNSPLAMPLDQMLAPVMASVEHWVATSPDSPFAGGTVVRGDLSDLESAKERRWAAIKAARDTAEFGGFTWNDLFFDSTAQAQSRIQGAGQLATLAMLASQPFTVDWTLADNAVRTLTGAEVIDVGRAMGEHIVAVHAVGRMLRAAIEAASTVEEVEAVTWPAG